MYLGLCDEKYSILFMPKRRIGYSKSQLRSMCVSGYDRDTLTNTKKRAYFEKDIYNYIDNLKDNKILISVETINHKYKL